MRDIVDIIAEQTNLPDPIRIIDVGAAQVVDDPWRPLVERQLATVLAFDPQGEAGARSFTESGPGRRYVPDSLGDGEVWPFHRCRFGPSSSVYEPNLAFIRDFNGLTNLMEVVETSTIKTRRLDDIDDARKTDYLKLDVQGFELTILENAAETLKDVSIVQADVKFAPLYQDQPLFADVDRFLRAQGFMLHTFLGFGKRALAPLMVDNHPFAALNQILWSDAVYIRPITSLLQGGVSPKTLLKRAILFHTLFRSFDYAARALQDYDRIAGARLLDSYVAGLADQKAA